MSKLTRSESARVNGAKSQGPITPEGIAISSMNAVTHGITAKTLILQNENQAQFLEILNAYFDHLQPANQIEIDLATEMVAARWRLRRIWRYETAILDIEMDAQSEEFEKRFERFDEDMRGGLAFSTLTDVSKGLSTAFRVEVHLSRTYRRTLEEFRRLRGGKLQKEPTKCENPGSNGKETL